MLLLSAPAHIRDSDLLLYEDNTAAMHNMLKGTAADPDSRHIVGSIWLLLALLRVRLWVEWVPSELNPADCFSRPAESEKQEEAGNIMREYAVCPTRAVFPAALAVEPAVWPAAVRAAAPRCGVLQRHEQANLAAALVSVDAGTLATQLGRLSSDAQDGQVTLGWCAVRMGGPHW